MKTILILEDEPLVMNLLRHMLKQYNLVEATSAEQALRLFIENAHQIDLLLADVTLPMSSGVQVALTVRSVVPDLPVVLTSGYSVSSWTDRDASDLDLLGSKSVIVMQKPNPPKRLLSALDELIGTKQTEKARTAGLSAYG